MNCIRSNPALKALILSFVLLCSYRTIAGHHKPDNKKVHDRARIISTYPEQITNPQKKNRKTFSQFGYNLYEFQVPILPVTKFIKLNKFGYQSYGKPDRSTEKNGAIYTCRGGFIDMSHVRTAIDWTVYLCFKILSDTSDLDLPWEAGTLHLHFKNINSLTEDDIASMAQKIAFERLTWHEIASWHYHKPYHFLSEQGSTFTPEDTYSNFLGTVIGKSVALRMLKDTATLSYSAVATEEIQKMITSLKPLSKVKDSKRAYDMVDLNKQRKLPENERNHDVWYDSRIVFHDERYVFKRYMNIGPELPPWLVPESGQLGCPSNTRPDVLEVPQRTHTGKSFYSYYEFTITPDTNMFYDHKRNRQTHPPFGSFTTEHYADVMVHINTQMTIPLGANFDKRDSTDPTVNYTNVKKVFLK